MAQIKETSIQQALDKIDNASEEELQKISEQHIAERSTFMGYLFSSAFEFKSDKLLEYLVYYYNVFVEAVEIQGVEMKEVDDDFIDSFHEEYVAVLDEYAAEESEELIETFCNQPSLLNFMMAEIHSKDEDGAYLSDELKSMLFIIGIALIGLLNRSLVR